MVITNINRIPLFSLLLIGLLLISTDSVMAQAFETNGIGGADASGGGGEIFKATEALVDNTAIDLKNVLYGGAAIGSLGLAVMAFVGRWSWVWFYGIIGGLLVIAGAQLGIEYMTGEQGVIDNRGNIDSVF